MKNSLQNIVESRTPINHFQPNRPLGDDVIAFLVNLATKAPSAYNMQNWRFIAVQSEVAKERLKGAAFDQQKVLDASVAFIVCGKLAAHTQLAAALKPSVASNIMEQQMVDRWVAQAGASHSADPVLQRDEAVRSASLASMTLMLAAQAIGLGSCAMSGFDAMKVTLKFGLSADELPVMIVAVGHPSAGNWPQKPRKALSEVLSVV